MDLKGGECLRRKDQDVPEAVTNSKKMFTLKELLEIFHNIESTKDKMLEADPNLEKIRTICQGRERKTHSVVML